MKGLIHIYCGDGKGKTTCAAGLAVRMAGSGGKVLFAQFLKDSASSELKILAQIPQIELKLCEKSFGFFWNMTDVEKAEAALCYRDYFTACVRRAVEMGAQMLVLDELTAAYSHGLLDQEQVQEYLKNKPESLEVVITGRNPAKELIVLADYVSEIVKKKHPFERGIKARLGIEM